MSKENIEELIGKLRRGRKCDNAVDLAVDIALFEPDTRHVSVALNAAGNKLVYRRADGTTDTYRALDHTLNAETRARAIKRLSDLLQQGARAQ
jgi:hypothetical protein